MHEVEKDIQKQYQAKGQNPENLLRLPYSVWGRTDLMIGIKYLKYFPRQIFQLPSGLTIYESMFTNVDGSRGIIGGPHRIFSEIEKQLKGTHLSLGAYLTDVFSSYQKGYKLSVEVPMLGTKYNDSFVDEVISYNDDSNEKQRFDSGFANRRISLKIEKRFNEIKNAGTEIRYRCIKCRDCLDCKTNEKIENISIQEEFEQGLIDRSVTVNIYKCQTIAKLLFIKDLRNKIVAKRKYSNENTMAK